MNARKKMDAEELRQELFTAAGWSCVVCGDPINLYGVPQIAHRVAKSKSNLAKWGAEVVHHPLNLVPVCYLGCNSACLLGSMTKPAFELMARIQRILEDLEPMPSLVDHYEQLREEFKKREIGLDA